MMFKRWVNSCYRDVPSHRDGLRLEIDSPDHHVPWLGTIDRIGARKLAGDGAVEIPLSFAAWRHTLLDRWNWISEDRVFVGCLIDEGVFLVLNGQQPLIKPRKIFDGK